MTTPPHINAIISRLEAVRVRGDGWEACCPAHDDRHASLCVGVGDDGRALVHCQAGCDIATVISKLGLTMSDLFPPRDQRHANNGDNKLGRIVAIYNYGDAQGKLVFQVVRFEPKDFRQRRPDGNGGWFWNMKGVKRVPYRLHEFLLSDRLELVFLVEGEKDCDRLAALGLVASCNVGGAGKWKASDSKHFANHSVVILPDNDNPGREHAQAVAKSLDGIAAEIKILELPGLPPKGDVSDWLNNGGTVQKLLHLVETAKPWSLHDLADSESASSDRQHAVYRQTDSGNAELFANLFGDQLRYDHARNRWLLFTGHWWTDDSDAEVFRLAKEAARRRYLQAVNITDRTEREDEAAWAISSESRAKIDATLALARAERPIADSGSQWDSDPWLLAVDNGIVDLRTGQRRDGSPSDRITMHSPVTFTPTAECPRFTKFLEEIFAKKTDVIEFVCRAVGYSLTGDTSEQCLFIGYGAGSNGKSTFLTAVNRALGGYAYNMPFSTIEFTRPGTIPNDLAALVGKRFVTASESNESTRLNESRIKMLTGCDSITARFLHAEYFTFQPVAKFWLAVNHKPRVSDTSFGFWRRVRLIPFTVQFTGDAVDKGLEETLAKEAPGILAWAVRGCLAWQNHGLKPPEEVTKATSEYKEESDPLAGFLAECCVETEQGSVMGSALYRAYKAWADEQGLNDRERLSSNAFGKRMTERFTKTRDSEGVWYEGIAIKGM